MSKELLDIIPIEEIVDINKLYCEKQINFSPHDIEISFFYSLQPNVSNYINSLYLSNLNKDNQPIVNKIKIIPIWKEKINISLNHFTPYLLKDKYNLDKFVYIQFIKMDDYDGNFFHPVRLGFQQTNCFHFYLKDIINPYMKQVPVKCKSLNSLLGNQNYFITSIVDLNFNNKFLNKDFDKLYFHICEGEYNLQELINKIIIFKNRFKSIFIEYESCKNDNLILLFNELENNDFAFEKIIYSGLNTSPVFIFTNCEKRDSSKIKHNLKTDLKISNIVFDCWNRWLKKENKTKLQSILDNEVIIQNIKFPEFFIPFINQFASSGFKDIDFGSFKKLLPKNFSFFPDKPNLKKNKILISDFSMRYISRPDISKFITDKIKEKVGNEITITDAMANVGGNTISFVNEFKFVNAIEINKISYDCLVNNIELYANNKNYNLYNNNYLEIAEKLTQDVVFFDPPWGGSFYKYFSSIHIHFNSISLSTLVSVLKTRYVVLKLPFNMNLQRFLLDVNYKESSIFLFQNIFIVILKII